MPTDPSYLLSTEFVRVTVRGFYTDNPERTKSFWAKPMKQRKPGLRSFLKVNNQGEIPSSFNEKANIVTETKQFFVVAESNIVSVQPAVMNLKYGELEVAEGA